MRTCMRLFFIALCISMGWIATAFAQVESGLQGPMGVPSRFSQATAYVSMKTVPSQAQVTPGGVFHVALVFTIAQGWSFYAPDPGGSADFKPLGAKVAVNPGNLQGATVLWSPASPHQTGLGATTVTTYGYSRKAAAYVTFSVPANLGQGPKKLTFTVEGQTCSDDGAKCLNIHLEDSVDVNVAAVSMPNPAWDTTLASGLAEATPTGQPRTVGLSPSIFAVTTGPPLATGAALGLAILAGLILNVMPCVLPVIPLRIVSLAELARQSRRRLVGLGLAFAGGILLFFVALAGINVILRLATSRAFDWGRHFQSPAFRIGMAMLIVALAVNLLGAFAVLVPRRLAGLETHTHRGGYLGSLGMGLMMAILATPCSFALLVLTLAWAAVQPLWLGSVAILLVGVGMAGPHAILAGLPGLLARLPRPGRWMELLKQSMGFALLLVALWLFSTLSSDTHVARVIGCAVILSFGLWVWGNWLPYDASVKAKALVRGGAVMLMVATGWWLLRAPRPMATEFAPFDESRIATATAAGRMVLVDFTADWCLSCKIVDMQIYNDRSIAEAMKARNVLAMRGDVTTADLPANKLLYEQFKGAPPLTVIFSAWRENSPKRN